MAAVTSGGLVCIGYPEQGQLQSRIQFNVHERLREESYDMLKLAWSPEVNKLLVCYTATQALVIHYERKQRFELIHFPDKPILESVQFLPNFPQCTFPQPFTSRPLLCRQGRGPLEARSLGHDCPAHQHRGVRYSRGQSHEASSKC